MKRSDIRNAYDAMKPTPQQRDQMYRAVMQKAGKMNGRYQAQPAKQHKWAWIPAAAAVIFICIMGVLVLGRGAQDDVVLTNPVETEAVLPAHEALLDVYRTAVKEGWTEEKCLEMGISPQFADVSHTEEKPAYVLLDIDGNGIQELIIGHGMPHYFYIWDLYSFDADGQPIKLHTDTKDHINCHLYKNGIIGTEYVSTTDAAFSYFRLEGTSLIAEDVLTGRDDFYYDEMAKKQLSLEELNSIIQNKYEMLDVEPVDLMENINYDLGNIDAAEQYVFIIEKYKTALLEHWDPGKCMEKGISLMVGYYGGIVPELGHNQIDLNGDGNDELIITDGMNIYDLYTIVDDEEVGPLRLIEATERNQFYLTTDGQIYNIASGSAMLSYYYLFDIGQKELVFDKGLKFDASVDPDNPWSYYEESMDKAVACTAENARVIMDAIHFEAIPFIPFDDDAIVPYGESLPHYFKDYAEHIEWLIPWREEEFEDPRPLYYCLTDCNKDGIIDLLYGYEDSVLSVWSYIYDKNSKTEHLTLLTLSDEEYTELDKAWLEMDIRNITEFEIN